MNWAHTVLDHDHASSMVIYNLNIKDISGCPGKTHTPLFVDTDAVLACTVSFQCFQAIAWRRPQEIKSRRSIQLSQLPFGHSANGLPATGAAPLEQGLGIFTTKTLDHLIYYISIFDILQGPLFHHMHLMSMVFTSF
jgi:hypothetical protein